MGSGWTINKSISIADGFKIMGLIGAVILFVRQTEMRDQSAQVLIHQNAESINHLTKIVERHELLLQENLIWRARAEALHEADNR